MTTTLDKEALQKAWLSYEEIESVKRWLADIEAGRVVSFEDVKRNARKKVFSQQETHV